MGAPRGNKNALGKETGRKSAYQEHADAADLWNLWMAENAEDEFQKRAAIGKMRMYDVFRQKGLEGSERILTSVFNKFYPDKVDVTSGGEKLNVTISVPRPKNE